MKKTLVGILLGFVFSPSVLATCIIVIRANGVVVIGADSLWIHRETKARAFACKIIQYKDTVAAFSGTVSLALGLDLPQLASSAAQQNNITLQERVSFFYKIAREKVEGYILHLRTTDPERYGKHLTEGMPIGEVVFVSIQNALPAMALASFLVSPDGSIRERTLTSIEALEKDGGKVWPIGTGGEVIQTAIFSSPSLMFSPPDPIQRARNMLAFAAKGSPQDVGGRVSIIKVSVDGFQWIERGECAGTQE